MSRRISLPTTPTTSAQDAADAALAANTKRAYGIAERAYLDWCAAGSRDPLPGDQDSAREVVRDFLAAHIGTGCARATLAVRRAAVKRLLRREVGIDPFEDSATADTAAGAGRLVAVGRGQRQAEAFTSEQLTRAILTLPLNTLAGLRDAALLSLLFAGAFRESEVVGLMVEDLRIGSDSVRALVRRSKADKTGIGVWQVARVAPWAPRINPATLLTAWLESANIKEGPVFRGLHKGGRTLRPSLSADAVDDIVRAAAVRAGCEPELFSGHSLRATYATTALEAGVPAIDVMAHMRHASVDQTLVYRRERVGTAA